MLLRKSTPAYKGARFDAEGFCLAHSDVRLCRLTSEGRYKIVRKTCYKCGSAALMTEPKSPRTTPHGYRKKALESRDARKELFKKGSSGAKDGRRGREDERRARTLSPRRGRARKQGLLRKPVSASHAERARTSNRAIKEPLSLRAPPFGGRSKESRGNEVRTARSRSISKRSSSESHNTKSRELTWRLNAKASAKGREVLKKRESGESVTSEGVGRCRVHPEVRLAIKRTLREDGSWQISRDVCPCCFPSRLAIAPPKSANFATSPKTVRSSPRARPATPPPRCLPFPSPPDTPEGYFATALVLHKKEEAMPNSAARIARMVRAGEKKKRQAELEKQQRRRAYEAWDSLPVGSVGSVYAC